MFNRGVPWGILQEIPDVTLHILVFPTTIGPCPDANQTPGIFQYYMSPRSLQIGCVQATATAMVVRGIQSGRKLIFIPFKF